MSKLDISRAYNSAKQKIFFRLF